MERYIVKTIASADLIDSVEEGYIDKYVWGREYTPKAYFRFAIVKEKGFCFKITCEEKNPKAVYTEFMDKVYLDSCLELFASFKNDSSLYTNLEMNANGALLMGIETRRGASQDVTKKITPPKIKAVRDADKWSVEGLITFADIDALFGKTTFESGTVFKGNFYKCGDETAIPHFGSWSPVGTPEPDFHCAEYFGEFIVE